MSWETLAVLARSSQLQPRPATSLEGVLAKLRCATGCIRDIAPEGKDPEKVCDIDLWFVFALERDIRRLLADGANGAM